MLNITKLRCWSDLKDLGFEPVKFRGPGRILCCVGARLLTENGEIVIEPSGQGMSDGKNYHVAGPVSTPFVAKFFRYEHGRKVEFFDTVNRINNYYSAKDLPMVVHDMLSNSKEKTFLFK